MAASTSKKASKAKTKAKTQGKTKPKAKPAAKAKGKTKAQPAKSPAPSERKGTPGRKPGARLYRVTGIAKDGLHDSRVFACFSLAEAQEKAAKFFTGGDIQITEPKPRKEG